jgi:hypothetical protein
MRILKPLVLALSLSVLALQAPRANAEASLAGLNTDGTLFTISSTGVLTQKAAEPLTSYTLGAVARKGNNFYYIATPSGAAENALYKASLSSGVISHVDLDLATGDDSAKALFFSGKKLFGLFYNSNTGNGGIYKINQKTGATSLLVDFSSLDIEPIGGAIARQAGFYYVLGHPSSDSTVRSLVRFKLKRGSATSFAITTKAGAPVVCDRIKLNKVRQDFVCLASPSTSQVDVCRLSTKGKAKCLSTLSNVQRIAGGHTMVTPDGKNFYAFVYAPGDENSQRLIRFSAGGGVKSTQTINTIIIGARFGEEDADEATPS